MTKTIVRTALHAALLACALPAFAQQDAAAQRVEITATRYDVRTVCPAIDADLTARLARSLPMLQHGALVAVQFTIDGQRIDSVTTSGGTFDTRKATRRAVHSLACDNGGAGLQAVRFEVYFNLDDNAAPRDRVAGSVVHIARAN